VAPENLPVRGDEQLHEHAVDRLRQLPDRVSGFGSTSMNHVPFIVENHLFHPILTIWDTVKMTWAITMNSLTHLSRTNCEIEYHFPSS